MVIVDIGLDIRDDCDTNTFNTNLEMKLRSQTILPSEIII
jgi:hypothetical protein